MSEPEADEQEAFDAIVIGSELGGLVTAANLSAAGRRTLAGEPLTFRKPARSQSAAVASSARESGRRSTVGFER
jgi:hypothetical protein